MFIGTGNSRAQKLNPNNNNRILLSVRGNSTIGNSPYTPDVNTLSEFKYGRSNMVPLLNRSTHHLELNLNPSHARPKGRKSPKDRLFG